MSNDNKINEIISVIAHELRSPLTAIKGYLTAINDGIIPPESQGKYINITLEETDRAITMLERLMSLTKFDSGAVKLNIEVFDVNELIHRVIAEKMPQTEQKHIDVATKFDTERLLVMGDKSLIRQVISNLADNAIKYNRPNGNIRFDTKTKNGKAEISVLDSGIGIAKDALPDIWKRFYQQDPHEKTVYKGHGLGLAIVKEIIAAHGSKINVQSEVGRGTSFTFVLDIYTE